MLVDGAELKWTEGDRWHANIELPSGTIYEYKYVVLDSSGTNALSWQRGNNSVLAIKQVRVSWQDAQMQLICHIVTFVSRNITSIDDALVSQTGAVSSQS